MSRCCCLWCWPAALVACRRLRTDCGCWTAGDPEGRAGRLIPPSQHSRHNRSLPVSARSRRPLRVCVTPGTAPLIPDRHQTFLHHNLTAPTCMESPRVCLATWTVSTPLLQLGERRVFYFNSLPIFEDTFWRGIIVCFSFNGTIVSTI